MNNINLHPYRQSQFQYEVNIGAQSYNTSAVLIAFSTQKQDKTVTSKITSKLVQEAIRERDRNISRPEGPMKKKDDPVDDLVRLAAASIGFVSEAIHYRRQKKEAKKKQNAAVAQHQNEVPIAEQLNEAIWELDAVGQEGAQEEGPQSPKELDATAEPKESHEPEESKVRNKLQKPKPEEPKEPKEPKDVAKAFLQRHPFDGQTDPNTKLALPVILPQRRPKDRGRGFVRAYAPVLADVGIDQETFLDLIDSFNKSLEPNPYLYAINLTGLASMAAPEPFTMLIGASIDVLSFMTVEAHSRFKSNKFLDHINAEFFAPRGLVCLIVTWSPTTNNDELVSAVALDGRPAESPPLTQQMKDIVMQKASGKESLEKFKHQFQDNMKPSKGTVSWPEPAPLTFPSLDEISEGKESEEKKKKKLDNAEKWLDEYMDRRGQAKWIRKNPDHSVANMLPKPEFRSRYADPNHPASSGDIVALFTGGRWKYGRAKPAEAESSASKADSDRDSDSEKEDKKKEENKQTDEASDDEEKDQRASKDEDKKKSSGGWGQLFQSNVLYLVITNLPQKEEPAEIDSPVVAELPS
ncbi:uncharacterized protein NECHADRAFT_86417 [Fusarium vanettenii 77-13-4]|uniref:Uncharacterized protein n=1 Tax=Fusarium vanettenii (strain ATCC MYA-4622 / CBS 123669 / FGSC 9596 / NRRL 45880 / 77-13-4) TaxID=660122 RepID=C7ZF07_FUSV7|nr:uncharacterized protein NECHADRAFT_86417 [Fusarium vanettenii 77-13-4]EEU37413.1 hypothetical protein NECHADRAFT_86417 [Fusarium vanettenii 77-13-4]